MHSIEYNLTHLDEIVKIPDEMVSLIKNSKEWMDALSYLEMGKIKDLLKKKVSASIIDELFEDQVGFRDSIASHLIQHLDLPLLNCLFDHRICQASELFQLLASVPINGLFPLMDKILDKSLSLASGTIQSLSESPCNFNLSIVSFLHNQKLIADGYESKSINIQKLFNVSWIESGIDFKQLQQIFVEYSNDKKTLKAIKIVLSSHLPYLFTKNVEEYFSSHYECTINLKSAFRQSLHYKQFQFKQSISIPLQSEPYQTISTTSYSNALFEQSLTRFHLSISSSFSRLIPRSDQDEIVKPLHYSIFQSDTFDLDTCYLLLICLRRAIMHLDIILYINHSSFRNDPELKNKQKTCIDYMYIVESAVYQKIMKSTLDLDHTSKAIVAKVICEELNNNKRTLLNVLVFQTFPAAYIPFIAHFANTKQIEDVAKDLLLQPDIDNKLFAINFLSHCNSPSFKVYLESICMDARTNNALQGIVELRWYSGLSRLLLNASYKSYQTDADETTINAFKSSFQLFSDL
eukprot:NODE_429_length_8748_cov_0.280148.p1 type:complete len:519 gc:universal NODE_429_length_8748_cov_0.280148:6024-4468(-)